MSKRDNQQLERSLDPFGDASVRGRRGNKFKGKNGHQDILLDQFPEPEQDHLEAPTEPSTETTDSREFQPEETIFYLPENVNLATAQATDWAQCLITEVSTNPQQISIITPNNRFVDIPSNQLKKILKKQEYEAKYFNTSSESIQPAPPIENQTATPEFSIDPTPAPEKNYFQPTSNEYFTFLIQDAEKLLNTQTANPEQITSTLELIENQIKEISQQISLLEQKTPSQPSPEITKNPEKPAWESFLDQWIEEKTNQEINRVALIHAKKIKLDPQDEKKFQELLHDPQIKNKASDKLKIKFKTIFPRVFANFATHGILKGLTKEGQPNISNSSDLDGETCLGILQLIDNHFGQQDTSLSRRKKYIHHLARPENTSLVDVGQVDGLAFLKILDNQLQLIDLSNTDKLQQINKAGEFFHGLNFVLDHHPESDIPSVAGALFKILDKFDFFNEPFILNKKEKNILLEKRKKLLNQLDQEIAQSPTTLSTRTIETKKQAIDYAINKEEAKILKEKKKISRDKEKLKKLVDFVDIIDSQGFQTVGQPDNFNKSDRTLLGLARFITFDKLWAFFKHSDGDYNRELTDQELSSLGLIYNQETKKSQDKRKKNPQLPQEYTVINRQIEQRKIIDTTPPSIEELNQEGCLIATDYGPIIIDLNGKLRGGATATQTINAGYLRFYPQQKTLYLFATQEIPENLFDYGMRVRKQTWVMQPGTGHTNLSLPQIIASLGGQIIPQTKLAQIIEQSAK